MPEAPVLERPSVNAEPIQPVEPLPPVTPASSESSEDAPRAPMNPLDNPRLAKLDPDMQQIIRYRIENSWRGNSHTRENIPVYEGAEDKSKVLNEGKFAVPFVMRGGDQADSYTGGTRLIFGASPTDSGKIILADDNRVAVDKTPRTSGGWEIDSSKIKEPVIITQQGNGFLLELPKQAPAQLVTANTLRRGGKLIIPITKEVSIGIADYDPKTNTITVFKRPTDTTMPVWINEDIDRRYEIEQAQLEASRAEKNNRAGWMQKLKKSNLGKRVRELAFPTMLTLLTLNGRDTLSVQQPVQPSPGSASINDVLKESPGESVDVVRENPFPAGPDTSRSLPPEGLVELKIGQPEQLQEKILSYEYIGQTDPDRSFEGWVQAREVETLGVKESTVGKTGEKYFDLNDPAKNAEVDAARRKFEAENPDLAVVLRQVAREDVEKHSPGMFRTVDDDQFQITPVKARQTDELLKEANRRLLMLRLQEQTRSAEQQAA